MSDIAILREIIRDTVGRSLRTGTIYRIHGDRIDVRVGGSPRLLRGLRVIGGTDDLAVGDTVALYEADGEVFAQSVKARSGTRTTQTVIAGGGGGTGMTPHAMSYHTDETSWHAALAGTSLHGPKVHDHTTEVEGGEIDHGDLGGLADDDHTQYILATGSRAFTGVVVGVTPTIATHLATKGYVDGTLVTDHGDLTGLGDDDHPQYVHISTARTITAQHTFAPASAQAPFLLGANAQSQLVTGLRADQLNKTVTAGDGMTGGGALTSSITLTLGTPSTLTVSTSNAITATSHTHAITTSSNPGAAARILASDASGYLQLTRLGVGISPEHPLHIYWSSVDSVDIAYFEAYNALADLTIKLGYSTLGYQFKYEGSETTNYLKIIADNYGVPLTHLTFRQTSQVIDCSSQINLDANLVFVGAQSVTTTAGNLTLAPTGDVVLTPTGDDVTVTWGVGKSLKSSDYVSQSTGWGITCAVSGGAHADFRSMYADEMHVLAFIADIEQALAGGQIICKSVAILGEDFAHTDSTIVVEDLPGWGDTDVFAQYDYLRLRVFDRSGGGLSVANVWLQVGTRIADPDTTLQEWNVTLQSGTGNVKKGSIVLDYGQSGDGYWEVTTLDQAGSPYSQIATWATNPWTPGNHTVHVRMGQLSGLGVVTGSQWGIAAGEDLSDSAKPYLVISDTQAGMYGIAQTWWDGTGTARAEVDPSVAPSEYLFWAGPSDADPRFIIYGSGDTWLSTLSISADLGSMLFSAGDGLLLLGPGTRMVPGEWESTRGQIATLTGAFHQEAGRWPGTRGLVVEKGTTNLYANPSAEIDTTGWACTNGALTRSSEQSRFGDYSFKCVWTPAVGDEAFYDSTSPKTNPAQDETYTVSFWVYATTATVGKTITVNCREIGGVTGTEQTSENYTLVPGWQRVWATHTILQADRTGADANVLLLAAATNDTLYFDGCQFELSTFPTSVAIGGMGTGYTTTDPCARTATTASIDSDDVGADFTSDSAGTILVWAWKPDWHSWDNTSTNEGIFGVDFDDNNRLQAYCVNAATTMRFQWEGNGNDDFYDYSMAGFRGWQQIGVAWDFTGGNTDIYYILNGQVVQTITNADPFTNNPTDNFYIGRVRNGSFPLNGMIGEVAILSRCLTSSEFASLYAGGKPLADAGSLDKPGIYITDGRFSLSTSVSGAKIEFDATGFYATDASGDEAFAVILEDATVWGGFTANAGDVVLGNNVAGSAAILWDVSTGKFGFYGNANATVQVEIDTDGSLVAGAGDVILDADGIAIATGTGTKNEIRWLNGATEITAVGTYISGAPSVPHFDITVLGQNSTEYPDVTFRARNSTGTVISSIEISADGGVKIQGADGGEDLRVEGGLFVGSVSTAPDDGAIHFVERSSDPTGPVEGQAVIWMSNGTGKGNDGDVMIASRAGGVTRYATLFDHSAGTAW